MYISTRGNSKPVSVAEAITNGMVPQGGLYVPQHFPKLSDDEILGKVNGSYQDTAAWILSFFLDGFTPEEIHEIVAKAYSKEAFDDVEVAPLKHLSGNQYILELWHGPTAAFKDMALQLTPHLMTYSMKKINNKEKVLILVATSGDTGKAALEGFKNVDDTEIIVFYPAGGVSKVQEAQMLTTDGNNTSVVAVEGNFDDCQSTVKEIFADVEFQTQLLKSSYRLSSANSINWGRLLPQIVYYFHAYFSLCRDKDIEYGEKVNFAVPTGNFGNILAGYYAKKMGLPIDKLICASNINDVLNDFFKTGTYDRRREFHKTISPSMDILISSNLERFLFDITDNDDKKVTQWMKELREDGIFNVDADTLSAIQKIIISGSANDDETKNTIHDVYEKTQYLLDPHTAVAVKVVSEINTGIKTVIDATANPYKFAEDVYDALFSSAEKPENPTDVLRDLSKRTGEDIHRSLKTLSLDNEGPQYQAEPDNIRSVIVKILESKQ